MKKTFVTMLITSISLFVSQCSENPTSSEHQTDDPSKSIKIAIAIPPGLDSTISEAYVEVSADDMKTMRQKLSINYSSIYGVVQNIPAGNNRHFEVFVYGLKGKKLMYYGDSYANIYAGMETYIKIILRQPGGTAIIDGYIEEYNPPSDTIPPPATPYIYGYKLTATTPPRCYALSLATNGSVYPDSLYYYWEVLRSDSLDTLYDTYLLGQLLTIEYPVDGFYQVQVRARRMYGDSTEMSPPSYSLRFSIRNGLLTDTVFVPDNDYPVITLIGPSADTIPLYGSYHEYGAVAYDKTEGDLTSSILINGYVDTTRVGVYAITYTVSDKAGHTASVTRIIIVRSNIQNPDTIAPVITLKGPAIYEHISGTEFVEPGYKAYDNVDGDITSKVITHREDSEDMSLIVYEVSDAAGNKGFAYRTVYFYAPLSVINK